MSVEVNEFRPAGWTCQVAELHHVLSLETLDSNTELPVPGSFVYSILQQSSGSVDLCKDTEVRLMSPLQRCFVQAALADTDVSDKCKYIEERENLLRDTGNGTLSYEILKSLCVELCFDEFGVVDILRRMDKLKPLTVALLAVLNSQKEERGLILSICCLAHLIQWNNSARESCCTPANMVQMVRLLLSTSVSSSTRKAPDPFDIGFARVALTRLLVLHDFRSSCEVHSEVCQFADKWMTRLQQDIHNLHSQRALQLIAALAQTSLPWILDFLHLHKDCLRLFVEPARPSLPLEVVFYSLVVANAAKVDHKTIVQTYAAILCELLPLQKQKRRDLLVMFPVVSLLARVLLRPDAPNLQLKCNSCFLVLFFTCQVHVELEEVSGCSKRACECLLVDLLSYCEAVEQAGHLVSLLDAFLASVPDKKQRALFAEVCGHLRKVRGIHSNADHVADIFDELLVTNESSVSASAAEFLHSRMPLSLSPVDVDKSSRRPSLSIVAFPHSGSPPDSQPLDGNGTPRVSSPRTKKERRGTTPQMQQENESWVASRHSSFASTSPAPSLPRAAADETMDMAEQEEVVRSPAAVASVTEREIVPEVLLEEARELREQLLAEQRSHREKQMKLAETEKQVREKDILLKDCLERLQAALTSERVQLAREREARAWADECQGKLSEVAQKQLEARTASERAETKLAEALDAKEKHDRLLQDAHAMLQSAQTAAAEQVQMVAEEREKAVELAQKLECVEEERDCLTRQVEQLSGQVEGLSRQLDEEREESRDQRVALEGLKAAAEEDAKRARKELERYRQLLESINSMTSGPPTTQTQGTPAKKGKEIAGKENSQAGQRSSRRSTRASSQIQQDSQV